MARADKYTFTSRKPTYYSDFTNNFSLNPQTGYLAMVTNEQAVINSIRNLILTNKFERLYQPNVGSKIQALLFDLNDPTTHDLLTKTITETINNFEPRARQVGVSVDQVLDSEQVSITIAFTMLNIVQPIAFSLILKRVR